MNYTTREEVAVPQQILRAYLATHAPTEPEEWFTPVFDEPEPKQNRALKYCSNCYSGDEPCLGKGHGDCDELKGFRKLYKDWANKRSRALSVQWRFAWADAMIEEMNKQ